MKNEFFNWEKAKNILLRILHIGVIWIVLLTFLCTAALVYIFLSGMEESLIAIPAYVLSAYTLTVIAFRVPNVVRKVIVLLHRNKYISRYISERELRAKISLYGGFGINLLFVAFKLFTGIMYASIWFLAVGVYYIVLSATRFILIRNAQKVSMQESESDRTIYGLRSYRFCGYLMFALNVAMTGMIIQMIWQNEGFHYPGLIIYASAAFTFYSLTMAIINMVKFHRLDNPILSASKMLSFAGALMSILALQTALLVEFSEEGNETFRRIINTATGGGVALLVFGIAIFMIVRANKTLEKMQINNSQT